jgi:hypothetical protein
MIPLDPHAKFTPLSVAAHTLYEKSRADLHYGPDGVLDLTHATYTQLSDGRSVRVEGSEFRASTRDSKWTIKLEGARTNGYHSVFMGGCADPILISQIDDIVPRVKAYVASKCSFDYELKLTCYGLDGALDIIGNAFNSQTQSLSKSKHQPGTIGILSQARAASQREANMVVAMTRIGCVHGPYHGQKATSGNFAMPTAPQEIEMGPISEFNIYHLMTVDDPAHYFPIELHIAEGSGKTKGAVKDVGSGTPSGAGTSKKQATEESSSSGFSLDPTKSSKTAAAPYTFEPNQLGALASVIRSKNSGPFEITIDAIFDSPAVYNWVKASGALTKSAIAKLYNLDESKIEFVMWWDSALAFKTTIVRPMVSGGWGEIDMHASCQHVPLMYLEIPMSLTQRFTRQVALLSGRVRGFAISTLKRPVGSALGILLVLSSFGLLRKPEVLAALRKWRK